MGGEEEGQRSAERERDLNVHVRRFGGRGGVGGGGGGGGGMFERIAEIVGEGLRDEEEGGDGDGDGSEVGSGSGIGDVDVDLDMDVDVDVEMGEGMQRLQDHSEASDEEMDLQERAERDRDNEARFLRAQRMLVEARRRRENLAAESQMLREDLNEELSRRQQGAGEREGG